MTGLNTSATSSKRRVRTGCLTCRRRRRKCPEERPVCSNCMDKNLQCRYGVQVVFVDSNTGERDHMPDTPRATKSYSKGTAQVDKSQTISPKASAVAQSREVAANVSEQEENGVDLGDGPFGNSSALQVSGDLSTPFAIASPLDVFPWSLPTEKSSTSNDTGAASNDEIELLVYYRYQIAPSLDLGLGSLFFGITVPIAAGHDNALNSAILALSATCRAVKMTGNVRRLQDSASQYARYASEAALNSVPDHRWTILGLLSWRSMLESTPETWLDVLRSMSSDLQQTGGRLKPELWQLLARLAIAARLISTDVDSTLDLPSQDSTFDQRNWDDFGSKHPYHQHNTALQLLHQSLCFLPAEVERRRAAHFPLVSAWQACWSEVQMWYSLRTEDLHHILEIPLDEDVNDSIDGVHLCPAVMFSNVCAVHSNVYHHLTALILLRNKPHLARPVAESESSVSLIWHALRIVGIVANASETAICDPVIMAALVAVTQIFSHDAQKTHSARLLLRVARQLGPQGQAFVSRLGILPQD